MEINKISDMKKKKSKIAQFIEQLPVESNGGQLENALISVDGVGAGLNASTNKTFCQNSTVEQCGSSTNQKTCYNAKYACNDSKNGSCYILNPPTDASTDCC